MINPKDIVVKEKQNKNGTKTLIAVFTIDASTTISGDRALQSPKMMGDAKAMIHNHLWNQIYDFYSFQKKFDSCVKRAMQLWKSGQPEDIIRELSPILEHYKVPEQNIPEENKPVVYEAIVEEDAAPVAGQAEALVGFWGEIDRPAQVNVQVNQVAVQQNNVLNLGINQNG